MNVPSRQRNPLAVHFKIYCGLYFDGSVYIFLLCLPPFSHTRVVVLFSNFASLDSVAAKSFLQFHMLPLVYALSVDAAVDVDVNVMLISQIFDLID